MSDKKNIPLVSSEISGLWNSYMSDSLTIQILSYFLNNVKDDETRIILQQTWELSKQHIQIITDIFNEAALPIPDGFTEEDVNIGAPQLFTDIFYLAYITYMARVGMHNYTLILNQIARSDIRDYFTNCIIECIALYNNSSDLRLSKGIFIRAPRVEVPKKVIYVKNEGFMTDFIGEKRPLILNEITHMFGIMLTNIVKRAIATGFGQTTNNLELSDYFFEGRSQAAKIINEMSSIFNQEDIPIPSSSECFVTDSTVSPFSEKLMLYHILLISSAGVSNISMAMAETLRRDIQLKYIKYVAELMKYAQKGSKIMIGKQWLEQPPQALNHKTLVEV